MDNNITIGMDLRDQNHVVVVMDEKDNEIEIRTIHNTERSLRKFFSRYKKATVAIEAGTHSPWINRLLKKLDCQVHVGNPRKLRIIWDSNGKADERDAEYWRWCAGLNPDCCGR